MILAASNLSLPGRLFDAAIEIAAGEQDLRPPDQRPLFAGVALQLQVERLQRGLGVDLHEQLIEEVGAVVPGEQRVDDRRGLGRAVGGDQRLGDDVAQRQIPRVRLHVDVGQIGRIPPRRRLDELEHIVVAAALRVDAREQDQQLLRELVAALPGVIGRCQNAAELFPQQRFSLVARSEFEQ